MHCTIPGLPSLVLRCGVVCSKLVRRADPTLVALYIGKANDPAVLGVVLCVALLAVLGSAVLPPPWVESTQQGPLAAVARTMTGLAALCVDA